MRSFCVQESRRPGPRPSTLGSSWLLGSEDSLRQVLGVNSGSSGVPKLASPLKKPSAKGKLLWTEAVPTTANMCS
eukprot:8033452-Pyramimonas_sp.AAC.1